MTKENLSEIICIVDRSGSMAPVWNDTVGGINEFMKKQREVEGEAKISLVFFDTDYEIPFNGVDLKDNMFDKPMTFADYAPRGGTALLDAIGRTINDVGNRLKNTSERNRPSKILVCIVTDGEENSSKEFRPSQVKEMIEHQTDKYQWEFIYLGANQDAFTVGGSLGIHAFNCATYNVSHTGSAFGSVSMRSCSYRKGEEVNSMEDCYAAACAAEEEDNSSTPSNP